MQLLKLSEIEKFAVAKANHLYSTIISLRYTLTKIYPGKYIIHNDLHKNMIMVQDMAGVFTYTFSVGEAVEMPDIFDRMSFDYYFLYKRNNHDLKVILFLKEEYRG